MPITLKLIDISGPLPTSYYEICADGERVGVCHLRHQPGKSDMAPEGFESHIYYEIETHHRGKGYAKEALRELKSAARKLGLTEIILVVSEDNIPSQRVIEWNNAELLDVGEGHDGRKYRKYRIVLQPRTTDRSAGHTHDDNYAAISFGK